MTEYGIVPLEFFNFLKAGWRPGRPVQYCAHAITPDDNDSALAQRRFWSLCHGKLHALHHPDLRGNQRPCAGRKLRACPGDRPPKLSSMSPTVTMLLVEQDGSAAIPTATPSRLPAGQPGSCRTVGSADGSGMVHSRAVWSSLAVANWRSVGSMAIALIVLSCPCITTGGETRSVRSHNLALASVPAVASHRPSALKTIVPTSAVCPRSSVGREAKSEAVKSHRRTLLPPSAKAYRKSMSDYLLPVR